MTAAAGCRRAALWGLGGCLGLIVLAGVGVAIVLFSARNSLERAAQANPRPASLQLPVGVTPGPPPPVPGEAPPSRGAETAYSSPHSSASGPPQRGSRLNLDLADGRFVIEPGALGSDLGITGRFDPDLFELEHHTTESLEGGREIRVTFQDRRSWLARLIHSDHDNELRITLPAGVPLSLAFRLSRCETSIELGGLSLTDIDLTLSMGEHRLSVSTPLSSPLPRFQLRTSMGDLRTSGLGNLRAGEIDLDSSMGHVEIDLEGAWLPSHRTTARIRGSMGDLNVMVPVGVRLEGRSMPSHDGGPTGPIPPGEQPADPHAPILDLDAAVSMGSFRLKRR